MFTLKLYDSKGIELKQGDIVKVVTGTNTSFYSEVKYLEKEQAIAPFHTFSFHRFEKVMQVPENAIKSTEERYNIWYIADTCEKEDSYSKYLLDWRQCEHLLEHRCYRIELNKTQQLTLF